jgi:hypothetical protein
VPYGGPANEWRAPERRETLINAAARTLQERRNMNKPRMLWRYWECGQGSTAIPSWRNTRTVREKQRDEAERNRNSMAMNEVATVL